MRCTRSGHTLVRVRKDLLHTRGLARRLRESVHALRAAKCPFVSALVCAYQDAHHVYLVTAHSEGGGEAPVRRALVTHRRVDLASLLLREKRVGSAACRPMVAELSAALLALGALGIAHRNLRPESVLLTRAGHVRLSDFDMAKLLDGGRALTLCG